MNLFEHTPNRLLTRRQMLRQTGTGLGMVALAALLRDTDLLVPSASGSPANPLASKQPHFPAKAKHIIHIYLNGGPSQVDTFDPKPALAKFAGQRPASIASYRTENQTVGLRPSPFKFPRCGQSGLPISEIFPNVAKFADDLCVIRS